MGYVFGVLALMSETVQHPPTDLHTYTPTHTPTPTSTHLHTQAHLHTTPSSNPPDTGHTHVSVALQVGHHQRYQGTGIGTQPTGVHLEHQLSTPGSGHKPLLRLVWVTLINVVKAGGAEHQGDEAVLLHAGRAVGLVVACGIVKAAL